ncbi:MAG: hypothetical protein L6V95_11065 [Candidatus Melainabacteria bacterium]|nr:MAG: hypothetical protein L6V95_11065 [Candidatus Melainabacteria bacterium]
MRIKKKKAIKWISGGHFLIDMYSGFLNPILPFIAAHLGISLAVASCIISISQITSSITQPLFGFWRIDLKTIFLILGNNFSSYIPIVDYNCSKCVYSCVVYYIW